MIAVAILIVSFALRVWGIHFGLPHLYHADEPIVVNHALAYGSGDLNPHFFNIPPVTSYLLCAIYGVLFLLGKVAGAWHVPADFAQFFFSDPSLFYLAGRICLGVIPAVLTVYFFMRWLARAGFEARWQYLGGILLGACFIHVSDAHYIYPDIPLVLVVTLFFISIWKREMGEIKNHLILGFWIGLAAALKYNGLFLALPYLGAAAYQFFPKSKKCFLKSILAAGFVSVLVFVLLNPYSVLDAAFFLKELREQSAANSGVPFWHHLTYSLAEGVSWPLLVVSFGGLGFSLFKLDRKVFALILFTLGYYLVLWQKGQPYGRYILPLVPGVVFFAVLAARKAWGSRLFLKVGVLILIFFAISLNLYKSIRFNQIMSVPDVRTQAATWIQDHIPAGSRIALDGTSFTPRLDFSCAQLAAKKEQIESRSPSFEQANHLRLQAKLESCDNVKGYELFFMTDHPGANPFLFASPKIKNDFSELMSKGIQYAVVVFDEKLRKELQQKAKLVRVWDPDGLRSNNPYDLDPQIITGGPFTLSDLINRRSNGYRIEVYALGAEDVR